MTFTTLFMILYIAANEIVHYNEWLDIILTQNKKIFKIMNSSIFVKKNFW